MMRMIQFRGKGGRGSAEGDRKLRDKRMMKSGRWICGGSKLEGGRQIKMEMKGKENKETTARELSIIRQRKNIAESTVNRAAID